MTEKVTIQEIARWFQSKTLLRKQNDPEFYIRSAIRKWPQLKGHEKELRDSLAKEKAKNHPWYPYEAMVANTLGELGLLQSNENESIKEEVQVSIKKTLEKLTEGLNKIEDMEFEELKAEVSELTEFNATTEGLLRIADYYNMEEFIPYLTEFKAMQEDPNYQGLSMEQSKERLDVQHKMFDVLKKGIGEEKAKELYRCL